MHEPQHKENPMKKKHVLSIVILIAGLMIALAFSSCRGPAGPEGSRGDAADITAIINAAIAAGRGPVNDGSTADKAFTVAVSGFSLYNQLAMLELYEAVKDYYVHLDLTGLSGSNFLNHDGTGVIGLSKILSVALSASVKQIAPSSFRNFSGLKAATFPGATVIGNNAFMGVTSLESITIPASVKVIGDHAFAGTAPLPMALASVIFEAGSQLEIIDHRAFFFCTALTDITIPPDALFTPDVFTNTPINNLDTMMPLVDQNSISLDTINVWENGSVAANNVQYFKFTATGTSHYIHVQYGTLSGHHVTLYNSAGGMVRTRTESTAQIFSAISIGDYSACIWPNPLSSGGPFRVAFNTGSAPPAN
jgi:hypothetical protein